MAAAVVVLASCESAPVESPEASIPAVLETTTGYAITLVTDVPGTQEASLVAMDGDRLVGSALYEGTDGELYPHAIVFDRSSGTVRDLGVPPDGLETNAQAIDGDLVAGVALAAVDDTVSVFVFDLATGVMTEIPVPAEYDGVDVAGISGRTIAFGATTQGDDGTEPWHSFAYDLDAATLVRLDGLPGHEWAASIGIDGRTVVGWSQDAGGLLVPYVTDIDANAPRALPLPEGAETGMATAVSGTLAAGYVGTDNDAGQAVAWDLDAGSVTDLTPLVGDGMDGSEARAMDGSLVVGSAWSDAASTLFAYDLESGTATDLGTTTSDAVLEVLDVDGSRVLLGVQTDAGRFAAILDIAAHP
jgi:hypothetical protein